MDKEFLVSFGEHIRRLRQHLGLSIRTVAIQVDIDPSLLGKIDRNERTPTKELISKLAKIFKQEEKFLIKQPKD